MVHFFPYFVDSAFTALQLRHNASYDISNHRYINCFVQTFVQEHIEEHIKAPSHWSLWRESTGD